MPVIAMTREMGSKGKDVAIGLAERIGLHIVHHNLVERGLSERLHAEESDVHRHLEGKTSLLDRWKLPGRNVSRMTACEVLGIAERGNVIIRGWGSTHLLRSVQHVLRVRVCAPLECRTRTMMERLDTTDEKLVNREILTNDVAHSRILKRLTRADWQDPLQYDLVINTERMPIDEGVTLIADALRQSTWQETPDSMNLLTQLRIESQVRAILSAAHGPRGDMSSINVEVRVVSEQRTVRLSGGVRQATTRDRVIRAVKELDDSLQVVDDIQRVHE